MAAVTPKKLFSGLYYGLAAATGCFAAAILFSTGSIPAMAVLVLAIAPILQKLFGFDQWRVPHHKVRLPLVSLCVFVSMALVLLTTNQESALLTLALANLGGFLLNTYWAEEDQP
jgi:hypothetical protein